MDHFEFFETNCSKDSWKRVELIRLVHDSLGYASDVPYFKIPHPQMSTSPGQSMYLNKKTDCILICSGDTNSWYTNTSGVAS